MNLSTSWRSGALAVAATALFGWMAATTGGCSSTTVAGDGGINCGAGSTECNGSCTAIARDPENCGACGKKCGAGEACSAGVCTAGSGCAMGTTKCGTECVDTKTDDRNCGACGTKCTANQVCNMGACAASCSMGQTQCGMSCVDAQTDRTNCGACGTVCKDGEACTAGKCEISCQQGLTKCAPAMGDGGVADASGDGGGLGATYCANLQADNTNCGACGKTCTAGEKCTAGACVKLNFIDVGPMHTFMNLTTDHYITQGACSLGQGQAADADYFCKRFYGPNCAIRPGYTAHTTPNATYPKMHKRGGCTSNGTDIPNTFCDTGPCKIGNWSETTNGLNNLVCRCTF